MPSTLPALPEPVQPRIALWPPALWPLIPPVRKPLHIRPAKMATFARWIANDGSHFWYPVLGSPLVPFAGREIPVAYPRLTEILSEPEISRLDWWFFGYAGCLPSEASGRPQHGIAYWRLSYLLSRNDTTPVLLDVTYQPELLTRLIRRLS